MINFDNLQDQSMNDMQSDAIFPGKDMNNENPLSVKQIKTSSEFGDSVVTVVSKYCLTFNNIFFQCCLKETYIDCWNSRSSLGALLIIWKCDSPSLKRLTGVLVTTRLRNLLQYDFFSVLSFLCPDVGQFRPSFESMNALEPRTTIQ